MDRNGDESVVVVGGGIIGCSIAVHLVDRGVLPVLIDPERPGQGTSTGSFASISAFGKDPVAWFQLACAGMSGWQRFARRLGGDVGLRRAGEVRVATDPEEGAAWPGRWPTPEAAATQSGWSTRPRPSDRLPIVGPLPWLEGLYLAVSHSGVTLAPVLGRLVADEVAEHAADGLLAPFRPAPVRRACIPGPARGRVGLP